MPGESRSTFTNPTTAWGAALILNADADTALRASLDLPWFNTQDYATVDALVAAAGALTDYAINVNGNAAVVANLALGAGIHLVYQPGCSVTINNGVTLTIVSPEHVHCPARQTAFTLVGTGLVVFGHVGRGWVGWWGATGDGVTDDTAAITAALTALAPYGTVALAAGVYLFSQIALDNPVALVGELCERNRWNTYGAGVTLLADGSADPAILIGGSAASVVVEKGFELAEGVRLADLLIRPDAGAGRGLLLDGSTTLRGTRGCVRDAEFRNVHVTGFTDHNCEMLGNVFDVRWHGCSSRDCGTTGIIGTTAASHAGSKFPKQIYFYDCYCYGDDTGPTWAMDGAFRVYGGGIAYGCGIILRDYGLVHGTHLEGTEAAGTIGVRIGGICCDVVVPQIDSFETALQIGDGTAVDTHAYYVRTILRNATNGIHLTDGDSRWGILDASFGTVTTKLLDDRYTTDNIAGSVDLRLQTWQYASGPPTAGDWALGVRVRNSRAGPGEPIGYYCAANGTPGTWVPLETLPGAVSKAVSYPVTAADNGKRFDNTGAGGIVTFTLPAAVVGMRYHFTAASAANAPRVDPDGAEVILGGGAGKYARLATDGASITVECHTAGVWAIVAETGTVTREA